jgi:hypothetical protein
MSRDPSTGENPARHMVRSHGPRWSHGKSASATNFPTQDACLDGIAGLERCEMVADLRHAAGRIPVGYLRSQNLFSTRARTSHSAEDPSHFALIVSKRARQVKLESRGASRRRGPVAHLAPQHRLTRTVGPVPTGSPHVNTLPEALPSEPASSASGSPLKPQSFAAVVGGTAPAFQPLIGARCTGPSVLHVTVASPHTMVDPCECSTRVGRIVESGDRTLNAITVNGNIEVRPGGSLYFGDFFNSGGCRNVNTLNGNLVVQGEALNFAELGIGGTTCGTTAVLVNIGSNSKRRNLYIDYAHVYQGAT